MKLTNLTVHKHYRQWLLSGLYSPDRKHYSFILSDLESTPFYSLVNFDENRALDGLALRREYENVTGVEAPQGPCSVLEVIIGLARRMGFILFDPDEDVATDDTIEKCFWELIDNLGLKPIWTSEENIELINLWLSRNFQKNGVGSPFPLRNSIKDQRNVELWYQMQAYLAEKMA